MRCIQTKAVVRVLVVVVLMMAGPLGVVLGADGEIDGKVILDMSLEDLLDIEVTSVTKRAQPLHDAAAAIFVVTNEDMERMGVTNVADALRHVPGLHVARIDGNKWAVTSRGFNGRFSNKLLVLVDGRSVYTTSFSGVYWEVQDLMLEDIERIEIIRGPGSTLWGANAVNGVINIISKHAADTQGGLASAGAGDIERGFGSARWGTTLSDATYARVYGKVFGRGEFPGPDGQDSNDDWNMYRGGFRIDSQQSESDNVTVQGDIYSGTIQQRTSLPQLFPPYGGFNDDEATVSGGHVLGRLERTLSPSSSFLVQVYFDRSVRDEAIAYQATSQFDYDFQHHFQSGRHTMVWGLGYRHTNDEVTKTAAFTLTDGERDFTLYSGFVQDEIDLVDGHLALTLGSKFEHNAYTGAEVQPSARFMWRAHDQHRVWAAVSRAVRTPSRAEDEFEILTVVMPPASPVNPGPLPVGVMATGNEDYVSEELLAYELGYRFAHRDFSADVAAFYHDYTNLRYNTMGAPDVRYLEDPAYVAQPLIFVNDLAMNNYGVELALAWQTRSWLRWNLAYSYLQNDPEVTPVDQFSDAQDPEHQASLNVGLQPSSSVNLSAGMRYVDENVALSATSPTGILIPEYTSLDVRVSWRVSNDVELSLVGRDLLKEQHLEYVSETFTLLTEVPRSFYGTIRWDF